MQNIERRRVKIDFGLLLMDGGSREQAKAIELILANAAGLCSRPGVM